MKIAVGTNAIIALAMPSAVATAHPHKKPIRPVDRAGYSVHPDVVATIKSNQRSPFVA